MEGLFSCVRVIGWSSRTPLPVLSPLHRAMRPWRLEPGSEHPISGCCRREPGEIERRPGEGGIPSPRNRKLPVRGEAQKFFCRFAKTKIKILGTSQIGGESLNCRRGEADGRDRGVPPRNLRFKWAPRELVLRCSEARRFLCPFNRLGRERHIRIAIFAQTPALLYRRAAVKFLEGDFEWTSTPISAASD